MSEYYVYELIDPRNSKIFYIGKGQKKRMYQHVKDVQCGRIPNNNKKLSNKIKKILKLGLKVKYKKLFITKNEQKAFNNEIKIIKEIELKNLCNLTEGGEGTSGRICTEETKRKMSEANKGQIPWIKGKTHSAESKRKIGAASQDNHYGLGMKFSDETKRKMSESRKGEKNHFYGKKHSEETKRKISETKKKEK